MNKMMHVPMFKNFNLSYYLNQYNMKLNLVLIMFIGFFTSSCMQKSGTRWNISSPGGKLVTTVVINENGQVVYTLENEGQTVIEPSPMGLVFEEAIFDKGLVFSSNDHVTEKTDSYNLISGKKLKNNPKWNEMTLYFTNPDGENIGICFRLFDDGMAFNYVFEDSVDQRYTLQKELTGFKIPDNSNAWIAPYDTISPWAPSYETFYENKIPVGTKSPWNKNGWALPMLFNTGNNWTLIAEANLRQDHAGMYVDGDPQNNLYTLILPKDEEIMGRCSAHPVLKLPFETAWRVIMVGDNPGVMVESNLITDLSGPSIIEDASWIIPGKSSWSWWSESDSPKDFERLKDYIDFSAQMNWNYTLVDANWNIMEGGTLEKLTKYANSKNVGILAWYNSGGPHNEVTEMPRDRMHEREVRRAEFQKISEWGVKGIKVDFFHSDKPCILNQYLDILRDAADYQLLVNFHGATIPRGWRRTFPNLLTMESVRGAEVYRFSADYPDYAPVHNTILPFTRNAIGPMDYTPVTFSDSKYPHKTTFAHELALAVVFESGLQHFADSDKSYLNQPDVVIDYLKQVPVVWDESRYVSGAPGEMVVLARRSGSKWYLSGINGLNENITFESKLDFPGEGKFKISLIKDGTDEKSFSHEVLKINTGDSINVRMLPHGGFSAVIEKVNP
jgi:alpha-glucosidase